MDVVEFLSEVEDVLGVDAYFGVPDSTLAALSGALCERHGLVGRHVIAANEGGAVGLAAGHYLATGRPAMVYMQNSGIGNAMNPACSLIHPDVYGIPVLFVVGWRGEPGVADEPQHVFQGRCTIDALECMGLSVHVLSADTMRAELRVTLREVAEAFSRGESACILVRRGALSGRALAGAGNGFVMSREQAIEAIVSHVPVDAAVVSTTGMASRELFEIRERFGQPHDQDFLVVGSMGHASMVGLGIALAQSERRVVVLDGDGAAIMHMGSMAVLAGQNVSNLVHVVLDNRSHESVGGVPTASSNVDWVGLAKAVGYGECIDVTSVDELHVAFGDVMSRDLGHGSVFIAVHVATGSRSDLGRPSVGPHETRERFMAHLGGER